MNLGKFKGVKGKYLNMDVDLLKKYKPDRLEEFDGVSCVYLLFDKNDELLYVGQTYDLENRFFERHKMEGKFHRFSVIEFKDRYDDDWDRRKEQRERLERTLIGKYRPPYNIEDNLTMVDSNRDTL